MLIHKDAKPKDTIKRIRSILSKMGIQVSKTDSSFFRNLCHSCRIEIKKAPGIGTNGKGFSKQYSLASAYGEFMERLQNRLLFSAFYGAGEYYGCIKIKQNPFFDAVDMTYKELLKNKKDVIKCLVDSECLDEAFSSDHVFKCVPFYNLTNEQVEYLPLKLIRWACLTNGTCAGNTPEEALIQGICEIFERFCGREIFNPGKEVNIPTIPTANFEKDPEVFPLLNKLKSNGFNIIIKDCTLNAKYPVLGTIIIDSKTGKYAVKLGSDPISSVALARCISETFQGIDDIDEFRSTALMMNISDSNEQINSLSSIFNPQFRCSNDMFFSSIESKYKTAFKKSFESNRESLDFLLKLIKDRGYNIYIRDVSYLGFPSYCVYIPGLSELQTLTSNVIDVINNQYFMKECLLNLKNASIDDILKCSGLIKKAMESVISFRSKEEIISVITETRFCEKSDFNQFRSPELLLTLMLNKVGDYRGAYNYLNKLFKEDLLDNGDDNSYSLCALSYFKLMSENKSLDTIGSMLSDVFGNEIADGVIGNFSNRENSFDYLVLPYCGDCVQCPVSNECYYDIWKEVDSLLIREMASNPIDQNGIGKYLKNIGVNY